MGQMTPIPANRNGHAEDALAWGADAILWIDADQTFPETALERLVSHGKDIVGSNCARRARPTGPTAARITPDGLASHWTTPESVRKGVLEEVAHIGLGLCLISRAVFERVPRPWFEEARASTGHLVTEDVYFMEKARAAGFQVWCDPVVSWQTGHVLETVLYPQDAWQDREQYLAEQAKAAE